MGFRRVLTLLVILLFLVWLAATTDDGRYAFGFGGEKSDYYNLLVDGFKAGQLSMNVEPHPDLLSPDVTVRSRAPYLLDASLYDGKYYLYFGAVPAVFLFLPYAVLTGHDLPQNVALVIMVFTGFLIQWRTLTLVQRTYLRTTGAWCEALLTVLLAFGAATLVLVRTSGMYEIAIAGGYVAVSLSWLALFHVLHSPHPARWLTVASLAAGLAVGCRPPLAALLPFVAVAGAVVAWRERNPRRWIRLAGAAIIPAGAVGLLLMSYNDARFDDPLEFGFNHALAALNFDGFPIADPRFVAPNLWWYYLSPPALSPHFPFVEPIEAVVRPDGYYGYEAIYGQALVLWLSLLTILGLLYLRSRDRVLPKQLRAYVGLLGGAFVLLLLLVSTFGFRADRYMADFQPTLILGTAIVGAYLWVYLPATRLSAAWKAAWRTLAVAAVIFNVMVAVDHMHLFRNTRPQTYRTLAYIGNYPSHLLAMLGFWSYGPVELQADFSELPVDQPVPLLATGHSRETDTWYVMRQSDGRFEFSLMHHGHGVPARELIQLKKSGTHMVRVEMGSLLPPRWHPYFRAWSPQAMENAKLTARLFLDGEALIDARAAFFDASPWRLSLGRSPADPSNRFTGELQLRARLPASPADYVTRTGRRGIWRLDVEVRRDAVNVGLPLLASGVPGAGNLLSLMVRGDGMAEFQLDQWGMGLTRSEPFALPESEAPLTIDVIIGPKVAAHEWDPPVPAEQGIERLAQRMQVWMDGELRWNEALVLHLDSYDNVGVGSNAQGFSSAMGTYPSRFTNVRLQPAEERAILDRSLRLP